MPLVTVKEKFQVTIPAKLRDQVAIAVGDVLEATIQQGAIVLRPKSVVDRAGVADEVDRILAHAPTAPEDEGRGEDEILEEAVAEVRAARKERRKSRR